jgi:uncharacterized protein
MKIDRVAAEGRNLFTGYGEGYVEVNGRRIASSVLVNAVQLAEWDVRSVAQLTEEKLAAVLALKPEIVLLGSGADFTFPDAAVLAPFYRARIGLEVMDTRAACRTYNILLGEDRNVVAALIV